MPLSQILLLVILVCIYQLKIKQIDNNNMVLIGFQKQFSRNWLHFRVKCFTEENKSGFSEKAIPLNAAKWSKERCTFVPFTISVFVDWINKFSPTLHYHIIMISSFGLISEWNCIVIQGLDSMLKGGCVALFIWQPHGLFFFEKVLMGSSAIHYLSCAVFV